MAGRQINSLGLLSEQKSLLWRIPRFRRIRQTECDVMKQEFSLTTCEGLKPLNWLIRFETIQHPDDRADQGWNGKMITLCVEFKKVPLELVNSSGHISVRIGEKEKLFQYHREVKFEKGAQVITQAEDSQQWISMSEMLTDAALSADGSIEIEFRVSVYHPQKQKASVTMLEQSYERVFARTLRDQLTVLRTEPHDIQSTRTRIFSKDGVEFPVDRVILSMRSNTFSGMFQSDMKEAREGVVELEDIDSKALEVLLHFLHTAELAANWKEEGIVEGLLYGAHKYHLNDLLEFLDKAIGLVCTDKNCGKLAGLAETLNLTKAEKDLDAFFQKCIVGDEEKKKKFDDDKTAAKMLNYI